MSQNIRIENDPSIVNLSRTVVGDGMRPNRIVLRDDGHQFITHREIFRVAVVGDTVTFTHDSFENGNYFRYGKGGGTREEAKADATKDFQNRSKGI